MKGVADDVNPSLCQHVILFDVPSVDYRYEAKRWIPLKPANTGRRPILLTFPSSDDYYDLNETKLEEKARMNTTGTGGRHDDETATSDTMKQNMCIVSTILGIPSLIK